MLAHARKIETTEAGFVTMLMDRLQAVEQHNQLFACSVGIEHAKDNCIGT